MVREKLERLRDSQFSVAFASWEVDLSLRHSCGVWIRVGSMREYRGIIRGADAKWFLERGRS